MARWELFVMRWWLTPESIYWFIYWWRVRVLYKAACLGGRYVGHWVYWLYIVLDGIIWCYWVYMVGYGTKLTIMDCRFEIGLKGVIPVRLRGAYDV